MRHSKMFAIGFCLTSTLLLGACGRYPSTWDPEELILPGNLPPQQQVKIWSRDSLFRWHAVIYTRDSITGIPYLMPTKCDGCRVALSRSAVDSIRVGNPPSPRDYEKQEVGTFLGGMVIAVALLIFHIGK